MKYLSILAALMFATGVQAQMAGSRLEPPSCFVTNGGAGYTMQMSPAGDVDAAWWCPNGWGDWRMFRVAYRANVTYRHPGAAFLSLDPLRIGAAYWTANVTQTCDDTTDVVLIDLCASAMRRAFTTLPVPPFIVRSSSTQTTRPTYPLVNGVRSTVSNGTVPIRDEDGRPVACNPAQTVREGSTTYMQVKRTPGTVAVCVKSPTI